MLPLQLLNEYNKLSIEGQLRFLRLALESMAQQIADEPKRIPLLYKISRLLQICDVYPMPSIVLEEKSGKVNLEQIKCWFKSRHHNHYTVTIVDGPMPNDSRIIVWFLTKTQYCKAFEIRPTDGQDKSGVGNWFFSGVKKTLLNLGDPYLKNLAPKIKLEIKKENIKEYFSFKTAYKESRSGKSNYWHTIRDRVPHYNELTLKSLEKIFGENKKDIPFFFEFLDASRPSNGMTLNVADCDICAIITSDDDNLDTMSKNQADFPPIS